MYGMPPPGAPGAPGGPGGPPNQPPMAGGDPRASKSLTDFIGSENEYVKNLTIIINVRASVSSLSALNRSPLHVRSELFQAFENLECRKQENRARNRDRLSFSSGRNDPTTALANASAVASGLC
jgi:hypothetical protein